MKDEIISCIGLAYIEPILTLCEKLGSHNFQGESKIQVSTRENGYSVSIIVLCVLMLESGINRVKYLEKKSKDRNIIFFQKSFLMNKIFMKD